MSQPKVSPAEPVQNINRLRRVLEATKLLHSTIDLAELTGVVLNIVREELKVDRATVFVVDWDRRELKSVVAQGVNTRTIRLSFGDGIAGVVAATGETLDILDAYSDGRFNPKIDATLNYRTRDIFSMPVINRDGRVVGVLELLNRSDAFRADDLEFLRDISVHVALALENAWLHKQLLEKRKLDQELALAGEIQKNLYPSIPDVFDGAQIAASSTMCEAVGGDYLDYYPLSDRRFILLLGDVSGKGIGAALVMTSMHSTCRALRRHVDSLEHVVLILNESLTETTRAQTYVTFIAVMVDTVAAKVHCVRAGHHPPLFVHSDGKTEWLDRAGALPIGMFRDLSVSTETYDAPTGSILVLYTDGITEAENSVNEHFGLDRLGNVVKDHRSESAASIHEAIRSSLKAFIDNTKVSDDTTLVVLKF